MLNFETKTMENLITVAELCGLALIDLKKSYFSNNETTEAGKKLSKFIADIKNIVDGITKSVKAFLQFNKPNTTTTQENENLPYPKEMADMLAGMTPNDHKFLKSIKPEVMRMMEEI
jgi:hypothetical protein